MATYKEIKGAQNYMVDDNGTVWHKLKPRYIGGSGANRKKNGRPTISLYMDDGTINERKVHQLVAEYFLGPKPPGTFVLHKDDDKLNNKPSNLYYGSQQQNCHDKGDNGTSSLSRADILAIRASNLGCIALAKQYNVNRTTIYNIKKRHTWANI